MSRDLNKVMLMGRLGTDPVQRTTKNGNFVTNFPLATSRKVRSEESGELKSETVWHRIVSWGKQAEHCAQYLKKGSPVFIEGSVKSRKWTDDKGIERHSFEVHAEDVNFLGRGPSTSSREANVAEAEAVEMSA